MLSPGEFRSQRLQKAFHTLKVVPFHPLRLSFGFQETLHFLSWQSQEKLWGAR